MSSLKDKIKDELNTPTEDTTIQFRVEAKLKEEFFQHCKNDKVTPSKVMKALIRTYMNGEM